MSRFLQTPDVGDVDEEEKITQQAIARGESAADFDSRLTPLSNEGEGLLAMFLQPEMDKAATQPTAAPPPPASLFESDLQYREAALHQLQAKRAKTAGADDLFLARVAYPNPVSRSDSNATETNRPTRTFRLSTTST